MLIFTRKSGQRVVVQVAGHPPLTITFLGSRPGKCQLAFDGPQEYHILREELAVRESAVTDSFISAGHSSALPAFT
ncbi:MAG TPA: carbon storage regulator [Pirellulaceae bacterium]|nr:carbon storage regulator [Pirellulaceae bacterium]